MHALKFLPRWSHHETVPIQEFCGPHQSTETPLSVAVCQSADDCARDPGEALVDHVEYVSPRTRKPRVPSWTRTAIQDPPILMGSEAMHCAMFSWARSPGTPCKSDAMTSLIPSSCLVAYAKDWSGGRARRRW